MKVTIMNQTYTFLTVYRKGEHRRTALNNLVHQVFSLSFENWYQQRYWNEKAVANISRKSNDVSAPLSRLERKCR